MKRLLESKAFANVIATLIGTVIGIIIILLFGGKSGLVHFFSTWIFSFIVCHYVIPHFSKKKI